MLVGYKPFAINFDYYFLKSLRSFFFLRGFYLRTFFNYVKIFNFKHLKALFNPLLFTSFQRRVFTQFDSYYIKSYKRLIKLTLLKPKKNTPAFKPIFFNSEDLVFNFICFDDNEKSATFILKAVFNNASFDTKLTTVLSNYPLVLNLSIVDKTVRYKRRISALPFRFRFLNQASLFRYVPSAPYKLKLSIFPTFYKINRLILKKYTKKNLNIKLNYINSFFSKETTRNSIFKNYVPYNFLNLRSYDNFQIKSPKRVKLKVNYGVLWRKNRNLLKETLRLKFLYQWRLTRYLVRFKKLSFKLLVLRFELQLVNILLRARFFTNQFYVKVFQDSGFIFLNGVVCSTPDTLVFKGEIVQILVTWKWFYMYKVSLTEFIKTRSKFNFKRWLYNNKRFRKGGKTRSYILPRWILKFNFFFEDVPFYLEVDYLTLSIIMVFIPNRLNLVHFSYAYFVSLNSISLYNWKYLT